VQADTMTTDLSLANAIAWGGYEFESIPCGLIYIVCEKCGHDRFEILDRVQKYGLYQKVRHSMYIAICMNCHALHDINICKVVIP
jgi:hypothetical protein